MDLSQIPKIKIGRNERCPCGSNKKYKKCCEIQMNNYKELLNTVYTDGDSTIIDPKSGKLSKCVNYIEQRYPHHRVINITKYLTTNTYKTFQTKNYYEKTIMVAERCANNNAVFSTRGPENVDIIVLYQGAYRVFSSLDIYKVDIHLDNMIKK